jgi:SAM-dependent methyltransferase
MPESVGTTDQTPELPPAIPGIVTPHAILHRLDWKRGWPERVTAEHAALVESEDGSSAHAIIEEEETIELGDQELEPADMTDDEIRRSADPTAPQASVNEDSVGLELSEEDVQTLETREIRLSSSDMMLALSPEEIHDNDVEEVEKPEPPPAPKSRRGRKAAKKPEDAVDSLMSELLEPEDPPPGPRKTSENWWDEVFDESFLRLVPDSAPSRTQREVAFLIGSLAPVEGARLLDVGCGTGRHALELATRGMSVVGVDKSRVFLERALAGATERKVDVEFLLGDMRELKFENEFDGVYCIETTFGYFDEATNSEVLQRLVAALKPGARLLIDQANRDHVIAQTPQRSWWETEHMVIMDDVTFDHGTSRLHVERSLVDDGRHPWEQTISIRLYAVHELCAMMRAAGLEILGVSGDIATPGVYFGIESRCNIVTARKPFVAES